MTDHLTRPRHGTENVTPAPRPLPRLGALRAPGAAADRFSLDEVTARRSPRLAGILGAVAADTRPAPVKVADRSRRAR